MSRSPVRFWPWAPLKPLETPTGRPIEVVGSWRRSATDTCAPNQESRYRVRAANGKPDGWSQGKNPYKEDPSRELVNAGIPEVSTPNSHLQTGMVAVWLIKPTSKYWRWNTSRRCIQVRTG